MSIEAMKKAAAPVAWCLGNPSCADSSNVFLAHDFTPDGEHEDEWTALYAIQPDTAAMLAEKDALLRQALDALEGFANITNDSQGVKGYHLNGDIAEWDEFDEVDAASNTIEAIRNHIGVKNDAMD